MRIALLAVKMRDTQIYFSKTNNGTDCHFPLHHRFPFTRIILTRDSCTHIEILSSLPQDVPCPYCVRDSSHSFVFEVRRTLHHVSTSAREFVSRYLLPRITSKTTVWAFFHDDKLSFDGIFFNKLCDN